MCTTALRPGPAPILGVPCSTFNPSSIAKRHARPGGMCGCVVREPGPRIRRRTRSDRHSERWIGWLPASKGLCGEIRAADNYVLVLLLIVLSVLVLAVTDVAPLGR